MVKWQKIVNNVRISSKKEPVEFWVGAVDTDLRLVTVARPQRVTVDLQSYYNFHNNDNFVLQTSIYSDETDIHMEVLTDINNLQSQKIWRSRNHCASSRIGFNTNENKKGKYTSII